MWLVKFSSWNLNIFNNCSVLSKWKSSNIFFLEFECYFFVHFMSILNCHMYFIKGNSQKTVILPTKTVHGSIKAICKKVIAIIWHNSITCSFCSQMRPCFQINNHSRDMDNQIMSCKSEDYWKIFTYKLNDLVWPKFCF